MKGFKLSCIVLMTGFILGSCSGGRAWQQKMTTTDEHRKLDMDLTLSVLQSRAALSIQMADNCYKK
jgi:hypothetical protein